LQELQNKIEIVPQAIIFESAVFQRTPRSSEHLFIPNAVGLRSSDLFWAPVFLNSLRFHPDLPHRELPDILFSLPMRTGRKGGMMMRNFQLLIYGFWLFTGCFIQITSHAETVSGMPADSSEGPRLVRTTAYTHSSRAAKNAKGSRLQTGEVNSAAADWSRYPLGTKFKILSTNKTYVVDDYGPALVGTNKIDLYMPSRKEMAHWGVRKVQIYIIEPGSYDRSLALLKPRKRLPYVHKMVKVLEEKAHRK
jgi:3D (Asp-Asp-Asp) domain-containing protein